VTPELARYFSSIGEPRRIETIYNGYDEADFSGAENVRTQTNELTIVLPGTFSRITDPSPLFRAIAQWRNANPGRTLRVIHVGDTHSIDVSRQLRAFGLEDVYNDMGYVEHRRAIVAMMEADLLMLSYVEPRGVAVSIPGRVYEALRTLRPVIGITSPNGALANLLRPIPGCVIASPDGTTTGAHPIDRALAMHIRPLDAISDFDRRRQTERLSQLCHDAITKRNGAGS
jgi:hypothetical protein